MRRYSRESDLCVMKGGGVEVPWWNMALMGELGDQLQNIEHVGFGHLFVTK